MLANMSSRHLGLVSLEHYKLFIAWALLSTPSQICLQNTRILEHLKLRIYLKQTKPKYKLDRGSIESSPRNGLSNSCRNRIGIVLDCFTMFGSMGDLILVLPALNLSTLNAEISMMVHYVS